MTILWCISDHGYGHATRSLAAIGRLRIPVIVRTFGPAALIAREAPALKVIRERNDVGLLQRAGSFSVDIPRTRRAVRRWMDGWDEDVALLRRHIREHKITLVVSDSAPQPFLAARAEGIPCVFFGSFTWADAYEFAGVTSPSQRKRLLGAYAAADLGIILPFSSPCKGIRERREIGLVCSRPGVWRRRIHRSAVFAVGGSLNGTHGWHAPRYTGTLIVPDEVAYAPARKTLRIPKDIPLRDAIRAADIVVGKSGYSLVAEAIRARVPLLLIRRPEFVDDHTVIRVAKRLGIAEELLPGQLPDIDDGIFKKATALRRAYGRLPARYKKDGAREAAKIIRGMS